MSPPEIDLDHLRDEYNLPGGDTGKWIFEEAVYRGWQESKESKLLWLCGGPGTGKSMLAKRVAAEFLRGPDTPPPEGVNLIFNFVLPELPTARISSDEAELSQLRLSKVASDLLYSTLQQDGHLFDGCKAELEKQGDRFFTNLCSLWKVLRKAIKNCRTDPVYILIDGIDGLKESLCKELIGRVLELMKIRTVKIFLSSRDVPHISNNLPCNPSECTKINLDMNSFIKEDVECFIRRRVNAWGWDIDLKERATEALLAKSEGIFLWASLAIENLTYFSSGPDFDKFIRGPPLGLQDVYQEMLHTLLLRGESREVLNMIWSVALALRPLTFSELGHILACIEEKARTEGQPSHERTSNKIRRRTEKEIRIYVRSSLGFLRATSETVSIVHHTATEFLFDEYSKGGLPVLSKCQADLAVSWGCFQYLHHVFGDQRGLQGRDVSGGHDVSQDASLGPDFQEEGTGEAPWNVARRNPQEAAAKWTYLKYAAEHWFLHARRSIETSKDNFCDDAARNWLQHQFFDVSDVIRKPWIELCGDSRMEVLAGEQPQLHIAVCLGLVPLVEMALSDFPTVTNSNWSPLHLAARFISGAYKILIAKGGPSLLTDLDKNGNTPLHEAAISGHSTMVKALVKKFTGHKAYRNEINKKNHSGNTPLHLASQFDHPEIVELLVKKGADTTIKNNSQMSVLELGEKLERGDSLNILKHAAEIREEEAKKEAVEDSVEEPLDEPVGHPVEELQQSLLAHQPPSPSGLLPPRPSEYILRSLPPPLVMHCLSLGLYNMVGFYPSGLARLPIWSPPEPWWPSSQELPRWDPIEPPVNPAVERLPLSPLEIRLSSLGRLPIPVWSPPKPGWPDSQELARWSPIKPPVEPPMEPPMGLLGQLQPYGPVELPAEVPQEFLAQVSAELIAQLQLYDPVEPPAEALAEIPEVGLRRRLLRRLGRSRKAWLTRA